MYSIYEKRKTTNANNNSNYNKTNCNNSKYNDVSINDVVIMVNSAVNDDKNIITKIQS